MTKILVEIDPELQRVMPVQLTAEIEDELHNIMTNCHTVEESWIDIISAAPQPELVSVGLDPCIRELPHSDQSARIAKLEEALKAAMALLPKETPGRFISLGEFYMEHTSKFAPPNDPMSKFKVKWFNDCQSVLTNIKEALES